MEKRRLINDSVCFFVEVQVENGSGATMERPEMIVGTQRYFQLKCARIKSCRRSNGIFYIHFIKWVWETELCSLVEHEENPQWSHSKYKSKYKKIKTFSRHLQLNFFFQIIRNQMARKHRDCQSRRRMRCILTRTLLIWFNFAPLTVTWRHSGQLFSILSF